MNEAFPENFIKSLNGTFSGLLQKKPCILVAIDGQIASGKSTLARLLWEKMDGIWTGPDEFVDPLALQPDWPAGQKPFRWQSFKDDLLKPLSHGYDATYQPYDWNRHEIGTSVSVAAKGIIIVEGMFTLDPDIINLFDYKIWVQGNSANRMARLQKRETVESYELFLKRWLPTEQVYIDTIKPWKNADAVIAGIDQDLSGLRQLLS